ncbi:MAG: sulfotransferase domain-containing protein [Bacteroidales bacterium]|nr:sulfotransferase domain-containing protein [Bacteroidales bacterium]
MIVDYLIIGAGRSGTTTVYKYLEQHNEICFSTIKEVHYFSVDDLFSRGQKYYHSFFENCSSKKVIVAADTYLFIDHDVIKRIYDYNPNMKFLVMLRNPVDRAFSGYSYAINNGHLSSDISFLQSIENEKSLLFSSSIQVKNNLCNVYQSFYNEHISKWTEVFPKKNFLLLRTKDLKNNPTQFLAKISDFLNVSDFNISKEFKANSAKAVKSKNLELQLLNRDTFLRKIIRTIVPGFIKKGIFKSGLVDKIHELNKSDAKIIKLTDEERESVEKLFVEDLKLLHENFNISFND